MCRMKFTLACFTSITVICSITARDFTLAPQRFRQQTPRHFTTNDGLPRGAVQLIDVSPDGVVRPFAAGQWYQLSQEIWQPNSALTPGPNEFVFSDATGQPMRVPLPWRDVRQIVRFKETVFLATPADPFVVVNGKLSS